MREAVSTCLAALGCVSMMSACEGQGDVSVADPPLVIAHRGASGYLPEHSLAAYTLGYAMGADYLEPDLVMTRDGVLVAFHDLTLEGVTNVSDVFPGRERGDGSWYVADFTLAELKRLSLRERFEDRYPRDGADFKISAFHEVLQLLRELNQASGCSVGVMPEIKAPAKHREQGLEIEAAVVALLGKYGYVSENDPVYIQSFDAKSLKIIRDELGSRLRLVQLIGAGRSYDDLVTEEGLGEIMTYANAIGPNKRRIEKTSGAPDEGGLVARARSRGLKVIPYTFRADRVPEGYADFQSEVLAFAVRYGVDGLFTDHPDQALAALGRTPPDGALLRRRCR